MKFVILLLMISVNWSDNFYSITGISCFTNKSNIVYSDENYHGIQLIKVNLDDTAQLRCPKNYMLHVINASFGKPTVKDYAIIAGADDAPQSTDVVRSLCENKASCSVLASKKIFKVENIFFDDLVVLAIRYVCETHGFFNVPINNLIATRSRSNGWNLQFNPGSHEFFSYPVATENMKELSKAYLHLLDFEADCDSLIISDENLLSLKQAEELCSSKKNCNFIVYKPTSTILCSSQSYRKPRKEIGAKVYVKVSSFVGNAINDFKILPNAQGICERNQIIDEISSVLNVQAAAAACRAATGCSFFTMSTTNGLMGAKKRFENHLWLCSGEPLQVPHEGFIFGERLSTMFGGETNLLKPRPYNNTVLSQGLKNYNGPLQVEEM